jgi:hypothetical protein
MTACVRRNNASRHRGDAVATERLRDAQHRTTLAGTCSAVEQFVARGHLRVRGILDLAPAGAPAVRMVRTRRELAHDALEVMGARDLEEVPPPSLDVVHIQEPRRHRRDQSAQPALPLEERPLPQVFAVHREQIERVEVGPLAPEQQALEVAPSSRVQVDDLSVDHRVVCLGGVREFFAELRPVLENVPVARHEVAVVTVDVGEGSEPVVLHLEGVSSLSARGDYLSGASTIVPSNDPLLTPEASLTSRVTVNLPVAPANRPVPPVMA